MPTIRRPNVPPATVRLTRAAGDAASESARLVPLRLVGAPPRSQLFVGASTTPTPQAADLAGDLTATGAEPFAYFYVPSGRQTLRVVAPNGEERTTTADFTFRSTANFLRILGVLAAEFAVGDLVSRARESLRSVGTRGWNPSDVEDAYRMDAALSLGTFPSGTVPPLETLATLATEQVVRWSDMTVVSDATVTGSGTGVPSRTPVTGDVTGAGPDGAPLPPAPRTTTVRTLTGGGGAGIGGGIGGASEPSPQPRDTTGGGLRINRPAAPTLRLVGRPPYSALFVDEVATNAGAWSNPATFDAWVMPLAAGRHTLRIVPAPGGGNARTATVEVPATGERVVEWGTMAEAQPAAAPPPPPPPPPPRDEPAVKPEERRDPVPPVDDEADKREQDAAVRAPGITIAAGSGVEGITATRVGGGAPVALRNLGDGRWGVTLSSAGRWNLTATTRGGIETSPEPVEVGASEVLTLTYAQAFYPVSEEPPQDHNTALGRVIVRSTIPNVAAMLQGGPTVSGDMARSADGTLTASVASGTYQLVTWQEATPMHRTNVRTANVTVRAGEDAAFVYTGTALVPATESAVARVEGPNPWATLLGAGASQTFVLLASIGVRQRDALEDERETLTRQGVMYGAPPAPTGSQR